MSAPVLEAEGLMKRFGGVTATNGVALSVQPGETHAVIGPNGAGKTTLVALLTGELAPDAGAVRFRGADVTRLPVHARALAGMARSYQITALFLDMTVLENVSLAVQAHDGHSFRFLRPAAADADLRARALEALEAVSLAPRAETPAHALSHGEQRQLEIAMALATAPTLLLLDEPMAGMGAEESQRMVAVLRRLKGALPMLLIEHDMDAVFALADRIEIRS
ncbi:MAG: ATP-binding cassette domain-containing protein, partial [Pseudomonadota bacterium]